GRSTLLRTSAIARRFCRWSAISPLPWRKFRDFMALARRLARIAVSMTAAAGLLAIFTSQHTEAHKPITSKYDYNRDVFPLLRDHCGQCHVEGGPGPMSLMNYQQAVPWAESIRNEVESGRMPPWPVDAGSPHVAGADPINARYLDRIVV